LREFLDTNVLVAAFWEGHAHHELSFRLFENTSKATSCCALHSLAEFYATMTALPVKPPIPPEQALLFLQEIRERLTPVFLATDEYYDEIVLAAGRGISRGRIYDALILRCAAKSKAETIYTWNLKHFQPISPGLSDRVRTP
jgi:predicted nucleic acid-binding protein